MRTRFDVPLPGSALPSVLGERTLVMGIINVTPDSFADGGLRFDPARAIDDGWRMLEDGADILDVGGESTRPGAEPLDADEELRRVLPVIEALGGRAGASPIDTYKAIVAREAVARGAAIINDISALQYDRRSAAVAADTRCGGGADAQPRTVPRHVPRGASTRDVAGDDRWPSCPTAIAARGGGGRSARGDHPRSGSGLREAGARTPIEALASLERAGLARPAPAQRARRGSRF